MNTILGRQICIPPRKTSLKPSIEIERHKDVNRQWKINVAIAAREDK